MSGPLGLNIDVKQCCCDSPKKNIQDGHSGTEVIILFSTQMNMKVSLLLNMKMPTKAGIFIFISREIFILSHV